MRKSKSPENSFRKTESALKPHALPEYLEGRTPKEKHSLHFWFGGGEISSEKGKVFFFRGCWRTRQCVGLSPSVRFWSEPPRAPRVPHYRFWKNVRAWYSRDTSIELKGLEPTKEWAAHSAAHAVSPVFAKECKDFSDAPPSAVRTDFSPRSRFEIPCNTKWFVRKTKRIFVVKIFLIYLPCWNQLLLRKLAEMAILAILTSVKVSTLE